MGRRNYAGAPATLCRFETAHLVMLDQPAAFAQALDDFLK